MTLEIILALLTSVSGLFTKFIGTGWVGVIQQGLGALSTLIAQWVKGSPAADLTASLTALQSILTSLQQDTNVDPTILPQINECIKLVEAAIAGYEAAEQGADPGNLPVPPPVQ
jgi:hypothetical protein